MFFLELRRIELQFTGIEGKTFVADERTGNRSNKLSGTRIVLLRGPMVKKAGSARALAAMSPQKRCRSLFCDENGPANLPTAGPGY